MRNATICLVTILSLLISACGGDQAASSVASSPNASEQLPAFTVRVGDGLVTGTAAGTNTAFLGLPYAKPPVGDLRWRAPQAANAITSMRTATTYGPDCMQAGAASARGMSEDCLYLNILTPSVTPGAKFPVFVWLHGGGFQQGSGATTDGTPFVNQGIVFVSINYRLGLFGNLSHPNMANESPSSGSFAMQDIVAALRWVNANIAAFGGDPKMITVGGQSGGATATDYLIASPLATGLFQRAIIGSMSAQRSMMTRAESEAFTAKVLPGTLASLRALPAGAVVAANPPIPLFFPENLFAARYSQPMVDGYVLPLSDREAFRQGKINTVDTLIGTTAQEGAFFTNNAAVIGGGKPFTVNSTPDDFRAWINAVYRDSAPSAIALYPVATPADVAPSGAAADALGDAAFVFGAKTLATAMSAKTANVWRYVFSKRSVGLLKPPPHSSDVAYIFAALRNSPATTYDATDTATSVAMNEAWARFIKTGNPNGGRVIDWPNYAASTDSSYEFGDTGNAPRYNFRAAQMKMLADFDQKYVR
jgi:carboxylesterase type B